MISVMQLESDLKDLATVQPCPFAPHNEDVLHSNYFQLYHVFFIDRSFLSSCFCKEKIYQLLATIY